MYNNSVALSKLVKSKFNLANLDQTFGKLEDKTYICVLDLELTCWRTPQEAPILSFAEIIEIGIVVKNIQTGAIEKTLSKVVKPVRNYIISDFCKELTGISQDEINLATNLQDTLKGLESEMPDKSQFVWATWGKDSEWLQTDLEKNFGQSSYRYDPRFIDVSMSAKLSGHRGKLSLVAEKFNLKIETPLHRALPDAITTERVLSFLNLDPLDALISSTRTYKDAIKTIRNDRVKLLAKRSKLDENTCWKILDQVNWDHTKAINIIELFRK